MNNHIDQCLNIKNHDGGGGSGWTKKNSFPNMPQNQMNN